MPETPVATPAAAPVATPTASATSVSTPASTPVSTPSATPGNEGTVATTPAASEGITATSVDNAAAATAEKPGKPERAAYGDDIEKFLKDTYAWEEANPDGTELVTGDEIPVEAGTEEKPVEKTPEEIAAEEAAKAEEKPADKTAEVEAPTPEGLSKILEANPGLKEALEAAPEAKGAIYAMARQNAKAAPILELVPNVEAAKFAVDNANQFVGLKTAFQLSDSPEKMKDAAGMFLEQFQIVDDKGAPILDAKGNPTYGDDLPLFVSEIKNRDTDVRIADLKERIEAAQYATPEGKENDEQLLAAYEFIQAAEAADPSDLDKPDLSQMTPEAKAYFEKKEKELNEEKERLGIKDKNLTEKQRVETRAKYDTKYREQFGASSGKFLTNYLKQKETDGVAIPHYLLTMKDPKTGHSVFALQVFNRLNAKLDGLAHVKSHSATLQMNALNDQALEARVKFGQEQIDEHLPGIIDDLLKEAGVSMAEDAQKKIAARDGKRSDARVEPAAGGAVTPKGMSSEQLYAKAKENVLAAAKGAYMSPEELMRKSLIERDRLEMQR